MAENVQKKVKMHPQIHQNHLKLPNIPKKEIVNKNVFIRNVRNGAKKEENTPERTPLAMLKRPQNVSSFGEKK